MIALFGNLFIYIGLVACLASPTESTTSNCTSSETPDPERFYAIQIRCDGITNIEPMIDAIVEVGHFSYPGRYRKKYQADLYFYFQENIEKLFIELMVTGASVKLHENWYNGRSDLNFLALVHSTITIGSNAFQGQRLQNILGIMFLISNATIEPGALDGLHHLKAINIFCGIGNKCVLNGDLTHLLPSMVRRSLTKLYFNYYPNHETFNVCFGTGRMSSLLHIGIICESETITRHLTPRNFTGLTVVRILSITECGIATIQIDTFNFIGHTLRYLILAANRLTTIEPILFRPILDKCTFPLPSETGCFNKKVILLSENLLRCNCEFYELLTFIRTSLEQENVGPEFTCVRDKEDVSIAQSCPHLQSFYPKARCLEGNDEVLLVHPKFLLGVFDNRITIRTEVGDRFRVFLLNVSERQQLLKRKCSQKISSSLVKCLNLKNSTTSILIDQLPGAGSMVIACVVYMNVLKRSWPLNCITIHLESSTGTDATLWLILGAVAGAGIIGGFILIVLYLIYKRGRNDDFKRLV